MKQKTNYPEIYRDVVNEYRATEGMTYEEIKNNVESEYRRRVAAYIGDGVPAYEGEPGITPQAKTKREAFKKKMQAQGRL